MKKIISIALAVACTASLVVMPVRAVDGATENISYNYVYDMATGYADENVHTRQMEKLTRGLVAVKTGNKVFLSWRLMNDEDTRYGSAEENVSFNIYRDGTKVETVTKSTNYTDSTVGTSYQVAPVIDGVEGDKCEAVSVWSNNYIDIPIDIPANVTLADGVEYSYSAGDASTGDLDGDGVYELVLKWDCNAKDNSHSGYTGNVLLDAYELDGTKLWRIDLGQNIRAGAHYTQFIVYDLDGDGKAEIACKTAPGSKDSAGNYVNQVSLDETVRADDNTASYVDSGGHITSGPEYYTVFGGDGKAIDTIPYLYNRTSNSGYWGSYSNGGKDMTNRAERYLGAVAYLDGVNPSVITWRGYYDRTTAAAYTLKDGRLVLTASFDTDDIDKKHIGQGNHNITVADVDNDGKDEVITGALCLDNDLSVLWCSGRGHGDALHIGDYDPTITGLEYFSVHESGGYTISSSTTSSQGKDADYGMTVYQAKDGEEIYHQGNSKDTGRGAMANVGSGGYYQISGSANMASYGGTNFSNAASGPGTNARIFWDGDLFDEILDGTNISSWNGSGVSSIFNASEYGCVSVNGTKSNPSLQADLFGDWREEIVCPASDNSKLRVFTTTTETEYKIKTLMHDPVYRSGVAANQTAYNQPPHVGIYMGSEMFAAEVESIAITQPAAITVFEQGEKLNTSGMVITATYVDGTTSTVTAFTTSGYDAEKIGKQTVTVSYMGKSATYEVEVKEMALRTYFQNNFNDEETGVIENGTETGGITNSTAIEGLTFVTGTRGKGDRGWYTATDGTVIKGGSYYELMADKADTTDKYLRLSFPVFGDYATNGRWAYVTLDEAGYTATARKDIVMEFDLKVTDPIYKGEKTGGDTILRIGTFDTAAKTSNAVEISKLNTIVTDEWVKVKIVISEADGAKLYIDGTEIVSAANANVKTLATIGLYSADGESNGSAMLDLVGNSSYDTDGTLGDPSAPTKTGIADIDNLVIYDALVESAATNPTTAPTSAPTGTPAQPTTAPTSAPTGTPAQPTTAPTAAPTAEPTPNPTAKPIATTLSYQDGKVSFIGTAVAEDGNVLIEAIYDSENRLVGLNVYPVTSFEEAVTVTADLAGNSAKYMLWSSLSDLQPIANAITR